MLLPDKTKNIMNVMVLVADEGHGAMKPQR